MADTTLYTTADADVREAAPDQNRGANAFMHCRCTINDLYRDFLKFDLSPIPATATITLAKLRVNCYQINALVAGATDVEARRVADDSWVEAEITWNNQKAFGVVEDTQVPSVAWIEWTVTGFVQNEWAGDKTVSICLKCKTEDHDATLRGSSYRTKEHDGDDPELYIEYTVPTAHEVTITDSVGMLDSVPKRAQGHKLAVTDIVGASDSVMRKASFHLAVTDIVGMLDSVARSHGIALTISDIVGLRDRIVTRKRIWPLRDLPDDTIQGGA